jgi:heme oxygenase
MTGAVSATAGLIIKQVYSSAKKRRIILEKIHENFAKVENLEKFLKDNLDYESWQRLEEPWKQYQSEEITERKLIKKAKSSLGKRFTELFIPHKKSRRKRT